MLKRLSSLFSNQKNKQSQQQGFTLIELLIVIVIIGILAGVLIAVIDPATQQNRARDANVRATMNKIALSISGYLSAFGRIPYEAEVGTGINGFTENGTSCSTASTADCLFSIANQALSLSCAANGWSGSSNQQCYYRYCGGDAADATTACSASSTTTAYRLIAKSWGSPNVFLYRSATSTMYLCDSAGQNCTAP